MNVPTIAELKDLVSTASFPCVSLFMPTHRRGVEIQQDPIRLENLLRTAERLLETAGVRGTEARDYLDPIRALLPDQDFWAHLLDGLALIRTPNHLARWQVPMAFEEFAVCGDRPYLKPVLPLLSGDGRYRVLALSKNSVRCFEGTRDGIRELEIRDLPQRLEDVVGYDHDQKTPQQHTEGGATIRHGHGRGHDDTDMELEKFVRGVDEALYRALRDRPLPMVLAAVDHVAAMFRKVSRASRMLESTLTGNFDKEDAAGLHARAWPHIQPVFQAERQRVLDQVEEGLGTGKVVQRIEEVVAAARTGRVARMLVAIDAYRWGQVDAATGAVTLHQSRKPDSVDLLDIAAVDCLLHGGDVHTMRLDEMPGDDAKAAAILRW